MCFTLTTICFTLQSCFLQHVIRQAGPMSSDDVT